MKSVEDVIKVECFYCRRIFYMDTEITTSYLCCPYCQSSKLRELKVEDRRIYVVISEHNDIECAFNKKHLAEMYIKSLEEIAVNSTWRLEKTYCY